jgi:hypothetical protein
LPSFCFTDKNASAFFLISFLTCEQDVKSKDVKNKLFRDMEKHKNTPKPNEAHVPYNRPLSVDIFVLSVNGVEVYVERTFYIGEIS